MVMAICGVKLLDKKNTEELMKMLNLKEVANKLARVNGMRWYGHVLKRPGEGALMKATAHELDGKLKQGN